MRVWDVSGQEAICIDVTNAKSGAGIYFKAEPGGTIWGAIRQRTPWFKPNGECPFHKTGLEPGEYNRRIARPTEQQPDKAPGRNPGTHEDTEFIAIARGQLTVLMRQLVRICQTVQPVSSNLGAYGHDMAIRSQLLPRSGHFAARPEWSS
jgi:hypothetical protein